MPVSHLLLMAAVYAAGIGLGFLLSVLLWGNRRGNRAANRWLAAATFSLSLLTAGSLLEDTRLILDMPHLGHVSDWLIFAVGPLLWLYVQRLTGRSTPAGIQLLPHAVLALLTIVLLSPFFVMDEADKRVWLQEEFAESGAGAGPDPVLLLAGLQILGYLLAALLRLLAYRRQLAAEYSSIERLSFRWLQILLAAGVLLWTLWMLGQVFSLPFANVPNMLAVPVLFYLLAWFGLRQPAVFATPRSAVVEASATAEAVPPEMSGGDGPAAKYQRSALDAERAQRYRHRLQAVMEGEKPWLENDLTLTTLAERVGISAHHLSQVLNADLQRSFFDYINERRVVEVQRCLRDPAYAGQSILDIALAAGFNSKTAFNAAFKHWVGQTPSQYRAASTRAGRGATEPET